MTSETKSVGSNIYTYDEFLQAIGGFGKFQVFASISLILAFMTGGQIVYGLEYLEIYPDYECFCKEQLTWSKC